MYSALFVADLHLGAKLFNEPELEQDLLDVFRRIVDIAISSKVTYLVIIGDLFDNTVPGAELIAFTIRQIERAKHHGVEVIGISGDHDKATKDTTWSNISGVAPVTSSPYFVGTDYVDDPSQVLKFISDYKDSKDVHWIVAHGQEPTLFPFIDEKKRLGFKDLPVFDLFPNLKGIVLGDIHVPYEGELIEGTSKAYIGYCGSPGVVKSDEINKKLGLLYWDGSKLSRIPFPLERSFVKIEFRGEKAEKFDINLYERFKSAPRRPVFRIEYDKEASLHLTKLKPLYQFGIVRMLKLQIKDGKEETVNIRTELSNEERISAVLRQEIQNEEVYTACLSLVSNPVDATVTLDTLKNTKLCLNS